MPDPDSQTQGGSRENFYTIALHSGAPDNNSGSKHNVCLLFTVTSQMGCTFEKYNFFLLKKLELDLSESVGIVHREGVCKKLCPKRSQETKMVK